MHLAGREEPWADVMLGAIRGDTASGAVQILSDLQRTMIANNVGLDAGKPTAEGSDPQEQREDSAARLLRLMEAARAVGLACEE